MAVEDNRLQHRYRGVRRDVEPGVRRGAQHEDHGVRGSFDDCRTDTGFLEVEQYYLYEGRVKQPALFLYQYL